MSHSATNQSLSDTFTLKFETGNIYFNRIYIVQSLGKDDRKTGQELYEDIIKRRVSQSLQAEIRDISSKQELVEYLLFIRSNIVNGSIPFIHFETHGFKDGICLKNGEDVRWAEILPYIKAINLACKNNLFISLAACKGGNIQFCVKIHEPCPFRGFIGPMEDVDQMDVLASFNEFFNILMLKEDFDLAIQALNTSSGNVVYHHMNSESFFDAVLEYQERREKADPSIAYDRVEYLMDLALKKNPSVILQHRNRRQFRKWMKKLVERDKPTAFAEMRKQFCHIS